MTRSTLKIETNELDVLRHTLAQMPDGTTCDILSSKLEAGNFETAHLEQRTPLGNILYIEIAYSGPVAEGYVSPFEMQQAVEADL